MPVGDHALCNTQTQCFCLLLADTTRPAEQSGSAAAEDRQFVPWLVSQPTEAELLRARHITPAQINRLEEAWKANPKATVDDIDKPGEDDEPLHVALK